MIIAIVLLKNKTVCSALVTPPPFTTGQNVLRNLRTLVEGLLALPPNSGT